MISVRKTAAAVLLLLTAGHAAAQDAPLSAIDWLSDVLADPGRATPSVTPGSTGGKVTQESLPPLSFDGIGLLPSANTGFSKQVWGRSSGLRIRSLMRQVKGTGVPAARALYARLLLARTAPPAGGSQQSNLLLSRIDMLLMLGALEEARALMALIGDPSRDVFRRMFDASLLAGDTERACDRIAAFPEFAPSIQAQVFCTVRRGDWRSAAFTLSVGERIEAIDPLRATHMSWFLDPELFATDEELDAPSPLTPLDFVVREAIGQPRPAEPLPLAFLHWDLSDTATVRDRIEVAERLVRQSTTPPRILQAAYRARPPAASGGVWGRAGAIQDLDAALDGDEWEEALAAADTALSPQGLRPALARMYAGTLIKQRPRPSGRVAELLLLDGKSIAAGAWLHGEAQWLHRAALALARGSDFTDPLPAAAGDGEVRADAALRAFRDGAEADDPLRLLTEGGREGEAILAALRILDAGAAVEPADFRSALSALDAAGQGRVARQIAVETLFGQP
ncbi:MAG: hypothetical protein AAFR57_01995 [Pseudomonadota bacterium]